MDILFMLHAYLRWLVVLIAVVAAVKFAVGWLQKAKPAAMDRGLMSAFSGVMDLQALLGIVFLVLAGISMPRLEHAFAMIVAVVVAHVPMRWRKSENTHVFRNNFFVIVAALVLIVIGVNSLPGGMLRWQIR
ncbi:MAG: hypothetical protein HY868_08335 [Chloroflexi bacterium]|nr:hypothetical protein [Chloroflexota bacterium]